MKDNELRSYLERIAHAVECIADSLSPKEAESSPEQFRFVEVAAEEKKEPEIAPEEEVEKNSTVIVADVKAAEEAFKEAIEKMPIVKVTPAEEVKVEEKPIVKKSPSKPRKEIKRINPYRKPEEGFRKPVSGFRIKED